MSEEPTLDAIVARLDDLATQVALLQRYVEQQRIAIIQALGAAEDCLGTQYEVSALAKRRQKVGKGS